jgi:hypothetical protein
MPLFAFPQLRFWGERMHLSSYQTLIAALPCEQQSAPTKFKTWEKWRVCPRPILDYFGGEDEIVVSREDVFKEAESNPFDTSRFIAATVLWGYPRGWMQNSGKALAALASIYQPLEDQLRALKMCQANRINDWPAHWKNNHLPIIGLSTHTKLLYFMGTTIQSYKALILDSVVISVLQSSKFAELALLSKISSNNPSPRYVDYLAIMNTQATNLGTDPGKLEMFLHTFGRMIKAK